MTKIGLFFGSFNPIHNGHIAIANYFLEHTDLKKIYFVVSPHNPLKDKSILMNEDLRLKLVIKSLSNFKHFKACDIEFNLEKPSYTANTLKKITSLYPHWSISLIMGSDSLETLHKWKDFDYLKTFDILVYKRKIDFIKPFENLENIKLFDCPLLLISSTLVREKIKNKEDISDIVPISVKEYFFPLNS